MLHRSLESMTRRLASSRRISSNCRVSTCDIEVYTHARGGCPAASARQSFSEGVVGGELDCRLSAVENVRARTGRDSECRSGDLRPRFLIGVSGRPPDAALGLALESRTADVFLCGSAGAHRDGDFVAHTLL